jgi:S1-C subfamily serine protease
MYAASSSAAAPGPPSRGPCQRRRDIVLAVGNPLGLTGSVTDGIISATGRAVTGQAGPGSPNATLLAPSRPAHHATANCVRGFPGSCGEPAAGLAGIG